MTPFFSPSKFTLLSRFKDRRVRSHWARPHHAARMHPTPPWAHIMYSMSSNFQDNSQNLGPNVQRAFIPVCSQTVTHLESGQARVALLFVASPMRKSVSRAQYGRNYLIALISMKCCDQLHKNHRTAFVGSVLPLNTGACVRNRECSGTDGTQARPLYLKC